MLFPQFKTNPITGWQIQLPKLGKVRINLHRPIPEGFVVKQVRIIKKAVGWFAVVAIESALAIPDPIPHGHAIGVDVGLISYIATSDSYTEPRPKFLVDHRGTSQICSNCRAEVRKDLSDRYHVCYECGYGINAPVNRDVVSGQEICNRGEETYRGNREKQEIGSQVVLSGNFVVDKWRNSANAVRGARSVGDDGSPHCNNFGARATK